MCVQSNWALPTVGVVVKTEASLLPGVARCPSSWGALPVPIPSFRFHQEPLTGDEQLLHTCFAAETPAHGGQVQTQKPGHCVGQVASLCPKPLSLGGGWCPGSSQFCPQKAACAESHLSEAINSLWCLAEATACRRWPDTSLAAAPVCALTKCHSYLQLPLNFLSFPLTPIPLLGEVSLCESWKPLAINLLCACVHLPSLVQR